MALVDDLNSVRKSPTLYDPERFKGLISKDTEALIKAKEELKEKKKKRGEAESTWGVEDVLLRNRLVLEDAFKDGIARSDVEPLIPPAEGSKDYKELREKYAREMEYAEGRSLDNMRSYLQWVNKVRAEQLSQVQVPVLGISFDVNDLGMLGGFAFIVLLIWVNYSLWHQSTNIKLAFEFAKELEKKGESRLLYYTYRNLAMRQVLTIPPSPASDQTADTDSIKEWVQKGSKLLYALPLAVQTTIVLYDWSTRQTGWEVNPAGTNIVLFTGTLFWCLVAILTALCFYIWGRTYNTWNTVAEEI